MASVRQGHVVTSGSAGKCFVVATHTELVLVTIPIHKGTEGASVGKDHRGRSCPGVCHAAPGAKRWPQFLDRALQRNHLWCQCSPRGGQAGFPPRLVYLLGRDGANSSRKVSMTRSSGVVPCSSVTFSSSSGHFTSAGGVYRIVMGHFRFDPGIFAEVRIVGDACKGMVHRNTSLALSQFLCRCHLDPYA